MFPGNEKELPETGAGEMASFFYDFIDRKSNPQNRIFAGETAIAAAVNALIGKIERREQPHRSPKMLKRQRAGMDSQPIELGIIFWRNQCAEHPNRLAFLQRQIVEYACKFHDCTLRPRRRLRKFRCPHTKSTKDTKNLYLLPPGPPFEPIVRDLLPSDLEQNGGIP